MRSIQHAVLDKCKNRINEIMSNQEDVDFYQPLFNLMFDEHRKILTQSEMDEIIVTVKTMFNEGKEDMSPEKITKL